MKQPAYTNMLPIFLFSTILLLSDQASSQAINADPKYCKVFSRACAGVNEDVVIAMISLDTDVCYENSEFAVCSLVPGETSKCDWQMNAKLDQCLANPPRRSNSPRLDSFMALLMGSM